MAISDVLATFPDNSFGWVLLEFYGIGQAPDGVPMPEFEDRVLSAPHGLSMTWAELKAFGNDIEQTFDCEIVAFRTNDIAESPRDPKAVIARICAFDSTQWQVAVDESVEEFRSVVGSVQRIAPDAG
ncbi:hypothetical protein AB0J80_08925 [Actinoplanes sp. NPDC049548]|uniref:hypothetical protein n=1 Tax=Actinoplanes sp. NPDC049548 TaxID=3155152 RepID=UPI0034122F12